MLRGRKQLIYDMARSMQRSFVDSLKMIEDTHNYRAPGEYRIKAEQFPAAVAGVKEEMQRISMIAFVIQAFVERSSILTFFANRTIKWIEKTALAKLAEKQAAQKKPPDTVTAEDLKKNGNVVEFKPGDLTPATTPVPGPEIAKNMNRRQRRRMVKLGLLPNARQPSSESSGIPPEPAPPDAPDLEPSGAEE